MRRKLSLVLAVIMVFSIFSSYSFVEAKDYNKNEIAVLDKHVVKELEKLAGLIHEAEELYAEDYTDVTWRVLEIELAIAKRIYVKEDLTRDEAKDAVNVLRQAINGLKKSKSHKPTPPGRTDSIEAFGNEFEIGNSKEFNTGTFESVAIANDIANGAIVLDKKNGSYPAHGVYYSQIIDVPEFDDLVVSWNSDTPEGTYVDVEARVLVNHYDENNEPVETWTDYFSWGRWSPHMERRSTNRRDTLARMGVDTLSINGSKGETGSKVQLRVNLYSNNPNITPSVRYLHGTLKNGSKNIEKVFKNYVDTTNLDKDIETPEYSQMIRNPGTSSSICSPTTITMMMNRFGEVLLPDEVAQNTYDNNYGFGNWSFAMASAGSYGYKSYVDFTTIEGLKQEIAKGYPVGVSVRYTNDPDDNRYPYIEGSPGVTPGHLIVVRGFTTINGVEYVIVNDSYAPGDETVRRLYKLDQFDKAWSNRAAYIIRDKQFRTGNDHTMRIASTLVATDIENEYQVFANGENIDVTNFGGVIAYTTDNDATHKYFARNPKNSLTFTLEEISDPNLKVYVITDTGKVYVAKFYGKK